MVVNSFKPLFRRPCPELTSSERTQQLRSKTVYSGTVNLAKTIAAGNNNRIKTYNGPYEVVNEGGNSTMIASQSYDDMLSITKGKVLLNQLPLNSYTQSYYQKNFGKEEMYVGNYNQFDPSFNFTGGNDKCNESVLVYDISANGFTGSYDASGGFVGVTGPVPNSETNRQIFIDPDHCYYSDPCLKDASYTRFVTPELAGLTGTAAYFAQQIIGADQYRGFAYPMPNFNLTCVQQLPNQSSGPLFCPLKTPTLTNFTVASKIVGDAPFILVAPTSNSNGAFTYTSSNHSVATISGTTVTIIGAGYSIITATQAQSGNYGSASISAQFIVNVPITPTFTTTSSGPPYFFGTEFHEATMTPFFDDRVESGFISANITNNSAGVLPPFLSVSPGQLYSTPLPPLYDLSQGQDVIFTLTVTYISDPPVIRTLTFQYIER